jgi:hypothetical protein
MLFIKRARRVHEKQEWVGRYVFNMTAIKTKLCVRELIGKI